MLRQLVKDSTIYGGADLLTKVLAFFTFPLIAAALSPRAFGVLELIGTTTVLLGLAVNCGLNNAVQRFYWDIETATSERPAIVTSGLAANVLFVVFGVFLGIAVIPFLMPVIKKQSLPITWIAPVSALLVMAFSQWTQYILDVVRLHFAPWRFFVISLTSRVFSAVAGVVVVVFLGLGVDGLLSAQALIMLAVLPMAVYMVWKDIKPGRISRSWCIKLARFGYPFIFAGFAYWLFGSIDRWMLAGMSSVEEVGIYSVAFRFGMVVFFVSNAFSQAWSPVAIKIRTDNPEGYRKIYGQVLLLLLFVMLVVGGGLAMFSGELIALIMPKEYAASALPLAILCFGILLQSTQQVTAIGISLEMKTYLFARLAWIIAFINVGLNYLLIPSYGATGAALATTISYLLLTGSYLYFTQRLHPLFIPWKSLGVLLTLGIVVAAISIMWLATELVWSVCFYKLLFALGCLTLGWAYLPIRSFGRHAA